MSTIEDEQNQFVFKIAIILAIIFAAGLIGWGIFCIATRFSFSTDTHPYTIDYYKGYQAVGRGILYISFGLASLAGLFWFLMQQSKSQVKYRIHQVVAVVLSLSFVVALVVGLLVLYKII